MAQISSTHSHHLFLSAIALGKAFRCHPVSTHGCQCHGLTDTGVSMCRALLEKVAYEVVLTSPTCLAHLTWMVCEIGGKWTCSWYL